MKRIYEFTVSREETVKEETVEKKKDGTEVTISKDVKKDVERMLTNDKGQVYVPSAIKSSTITNGIRYALATGNWGDRKAPIKAGVSQVRKSPY